MTMRNSRVWVILAVCLGTALLSACVSTPRVEPIQDCHVAAAHAVHATHISNLMKALSKTHARVRSHRAPLLRQRNLDYRAIAEAAEEIGVWSRELLSFSEGGTWSERDRYLFRAYVNLLGERAEDLRQSATDRKGRDVKEAYARLTATCNSCHYAFRERIRDHQEQ